MGQRRGGLERAPHWLATITEALADGETRLALTRWRRLLAVVRVIEDRPRENPEEAYWGDGEKRQLITTAAKLEAQFANMDEATQQQARQELPTDVEWLRHTLP